MEDFENKPSEQGRRKRPRIQRDKGVLVERPERPAGGYGDDRHRRYRDNEDNRYSMGATDKPKKAPRKKKKGGQKNVYVPAIQYDGLKGAEEIIFNRIDRRKTKQAPPEPKFDGTTRLNKYISNAGICSRRDADKLIESGAVSVNGEVITTMGFKVKEGDVVTYGGQVLQSEPKRYFLLNKPKGFITTVDDPQERDTVMMLIEGCCPERIYPVGRLDRNTMGLLLFTNDGELAKKLTHPSSKIYKIYQVEVDHPVTRFDMQRMLDGVELEDGFIAVDDVQYHGDGSNHSIVGVALHSGKNRIVRRIFEYLGYEVVKLDRVVFAGLTKKDLPRGHYRELSQQEINYLKMV